MDNSDNSGGAARVWYAMAGAAVALPACMLLGGGWLTWQWLRQGSVSGLAGPPAFDAWLHAMTLPVLLGVPAMAALAALCMAGARLARRIGALQVALRSEAERRHVAEEALHQAQRLEAIGRLTGGIAHDFNNQLTVISSNIELLLRRLPEGATPQRRFADAAMLGVRRAAALTQRLLALSRQQAADPEPLDAGRLVSGMLDLLRRTLGERVEIETICPNGLWLTRTDAGQLETALLNLAVNAREAMPDGGRLTLQTANATQDESGGGMPGGAPAQYVTIAVCDTGTGMPAEVKARATEPFFTTKPPGERSGLGLSMVQGFVRRWGGHLRIDSVIGQGTTVRLYLPRYVPAPVAAAATARRTGDGETLLVVEDDEAVRAAAVEALREIGYHVLEAPDAMEAVRLLADRGGVDLLFTDVGLPGGVNGRALADAARNLHPALKVLFTTGYQGEAAQACGLAADDECLLAKPFSLAQLEAKVRELLAAPATAA